MPATRNTIRTSISRALIGVALTFGLMSTGQVGAADPEEAYAAPGTTAPLETLRGLACAVDGDTLVLNGQSSRGRCLGGTVVHLAGLDAPELDQKCQDTFYMAFACGRQARTKLTAMIRGQVVECEARRHGSAPGYAGECFVGTRNLNAVMVREGWALVNPRGMERYRPLERQAQRRRSGIWRSEFIRPWDWRTRAS